MLVSHKRLNGVDIGLLTKPDDVRWCWPAWKVTVWAVVSLSVVAQATSTMAGAAPTYVRKASTSFVDWTTGRSTVSVNIQVEGSGAMLVVGIAWAGGNGLDVSGATFDGSQTLVDCGVGRMSINGGTHTYERLYYLANPHAVTGTVLISFSGQINECGLGVMLLNGTNGTIGTPVTQRRLSAGNLSVSPSSSVTDLMVSAIGNVGGDLSGPTGIGEIERLSDAVAGSIGITMGTQTAITPNTTSSWPFSNNHNFGALEIGMAVHSSSAPAATPTPAPTTAPAPAYPLKNSANERYLVDQNDTPFLVIGDTAWALMVNISESDAEFYFANRQAAGFNVVMMNLVCGPYTAGRWDSSTYDGIVPFTDFIPGTTTYDLTTPNEAYFAHVDRILNLAANYGLAVFLDPLCTGSYYRPEGTPTMQNNGTEKCRAYGRYVGNRYKEFPNIVWQHGNDYHGGFWDDGDQYTTAVAFGIKDDDENHIHTIELTAPGGSLDNPTWAPIVALNATYTWGPTYAQVLFEYNRTRFRPVFIVEDHYEGEEIGYPPDNVELGTPLVNRRQDYWTMTCGTTGKLFGSGYIWKFESDWANYLNTQCVSELGYMKALFETRRWYDLVPDQAHTVVTSGYGTYTDIGKVSESDYATAARTEDGSLVVVYLPTRRDITVDMTQLIGEVTAQWYDPTSATYSNIGTGLPNTGTQIFTPPDDNNAGDGDWVLVLEVAPIAPTPTPTPFPTANISGNLFYCSNPNLGSVANVTLSLTGSAGGATISDGSGNYEFSSLELGGNYTVAPTKTALTPASDGIDGADVLAVLRHFLELEFLTVGCQLDAADADTQTAGIDASDILAVQRFYLGFPNAPASKVGQYQFSPANRSYSPLLSNQTAEDYNVLIFGDVAPGFVYGPGAGPLQGAAGDGTSVNEVAATVAVVALPDARGDSVKNNFIAAVTTSAIDAENKLVGFQGDLVFDERVVTFDESRPVQAAGLTGSNWSVSGNALPGSGPIRVLRVLGYSNVFTPLSGEGTLFELRMTRVGQAAEGTQLTWAAAPHHFLFIDADLNMQAPGNATDGRITPSPRRQSQRVQYKTGPTRRHRR